MFKKRKDTKKEQVILEENNEDLTSNQNQDAFQVMESNQISIDNKAILEEEEVALIKPVVYKKPSSNQLSFVENEEEADHTISKNNKEKTKKRNSGFLRNIAADIDYSSLQSKKSDFYQSSYDINELRVESNKANQQTLSFVQQYQSEKENGIIDEDELQNYDPSIQDQKVNENIQSMEIEYSSQEKSTIKNIKEQRQVQRNIISKDDYIQLCGQADYNISNNMDSKRMAMFGESKYESNKFDMEQEDISDDEFNQMEENFVHNAMKQTNLVDRDYSFIQQKGSLQQLKRKKEETQLIASIDKINLQNTIQLLESNHLTNFKIRYEDDSKKQTIGQVISKSQADIQKWNEEIQTLVDQEATILENIEFWREFNDMMNEKSKELKIAIKENEKLNKRFLFSNEKRLSSYTNTFLQEMNIPLIKRNHHGEDAVEDLYEMFPSNIRRSAMQEKKKLQAKQNMDHHTYIEGYSSDEDSDLPEEDMDQNETKDFIDDKIALASAALGIMDEIEEYYKDFKTYLQQSVQYQEIDNSISTEDILFNCLKNEVQVELFAYDPLGRYSNQLKTDINQISFMSQINSEIADESSLHQELVSKVKQKILEVFVFDKLLKEILFCYNPYSKKLTEKLSVTFLQLADLSYISSKYKTKEVQVIFQKVITAVINKFEEYFTYTSSYPSQQTDPTKIKFEYIILCLGRNLRLISNLILLRKMIPASAIYSLGFERILQTSLQMISLFESHQTRAFYLVKYLLQIPIDLIAASESIKQNVIQVNSLLDSELENINNEVKNLSKNEIEQLEQIKDHLKQYPN